MTIYEELKATPVANVNQETVRKFAGTMIASWSDRAPASIKDSLLLAFECIMRGDMLDKRRTEDLYQLILTLCPLTMGISTQAEAQDKIYSTIIMRGSSYGNLVLNMLGTKYTSSHAAAKILRLLDCYERKGVLLKDELLDVAGYCVLNRAILECPIEEENHE